jgi:DNA end-binding protein Ku
MYKGTSDSEPIKFNQLHSGCGGRVGRMGYCKVCGKKWGEGEDNSDICKGYEHSKGQYAIVTDAELEAITVESDQQINIKFFVPADSLDIRMFNTFYYLRQDGKGNQLSLLKKAMEAKNVVGIAQVSMRKKEYLIALRPLSDAFILQIMSYPEELRNPDKFEAVAVSDKELEMATMLVGMMIKNVDLTTESSNPLSEFRNKHNDALTALVKSKIDGTVLAPSAIVTTRVGSDNTIDALERSIQALTQNS